MDIAAASIIMSQSKAQNSAGIILLKKTMDLNQESQHRLLQMINDTNQNISADPNLGAILDIKV
ncbi:hypothetical protein Dtox_0090 [Desulfofarcimen acetoxidans DSM 771]|jgi:hypothetical protein|uniref:Motility protein n=1 Tax=Desulfofarcimen acetoxidans (strain ATCC 49208 / DSM 771 / KCTC 5769 / VKM B-1644 / 5575) TaxID=485916 RepID=C8W2P7_DESAS|nr:YjfB family protein [Desulfofarcimen acetoxidans]ACV61053.1 hypothetical protein Dtox_0090 [Desulfofarcimen acetoxidans DSM 771]